MTKKPSRDKAAVHPPPENTREALLEAGKSLFAKQGFGGTTVKDISEKAGVNISLVSYHFQGKEGLYRACLEHYGKGRLEIAERMLQPAESGQEFRIRFGMFIEEMINWMHGDPDMHMIIQRECDSGLPVAEEVFKSTYLKMFETICAYVSAGQKKKFLRSDVDALLMTRLFFGSLSGIVRSDELGKRFHGITVCDPNYRKKLKEQAITLFLDGMMDRKDK